MSGAVRVGEPTGSARAADHRGTAVLGPSVAGRIGSAVFENEEVKHGRGESRPRLGGRLSVTVLARVSAAQKGSEQRCGVGVLAVANAVDQVVLGKAVQALLNSTGLEPGELLDDPNYGYNITDLVSDDLSPADLSYAQQQAGAQAQLDERVLNCTVTMTLTVAGLLTVIAFVTTAAGPFKFVCSVSAVTTQLLLVSP